MKALIDSGSEVSIISQEMFEKLNVIHKTPTLPVSGVNIIGITGVRTQPIRTETQLPLQFGNTTVTTVFLVVPKVHVNVLLGIDWLYKCAASLDFQNMTLTGRFKDTAFCLPFVVDNNATSNSIFLISTKSTIPESDTPPPLSNGDLHNKAYESDLLSVDQKEELLDILIKYKEVFSTVPGKLGGYVCYFKMKDTNPFFCKPYPIPMSVRHQVQEEIYKMIDQGIIERSNSAFNNPLVVVKKNCGGIRIVLDARTLNKHIETERDRPINIDDLLSKFEKAKYFSSVDLTAGYHQVPVHEDCRKFTAFLFNGRAYQYKVLPFGLNISVSVFIRALDEALGRELLQDLVIYVDDILIISEKWKEHCEILEKLLARCREKGVTLKLSKSSFGRKELKFLGHIVGIEGIKPDPERIQAIKDCPEPRNVKQLKAFLGLVGFYRRYIQGQVLNTPVLLDLLKKDVPWRWEIEASKAFQEIKLALVNSHLLKHPVVGQPFKLTTDASAYGIAAELFQGEFDDSKGGHNTIAFASRCLSVHERNYTVTEKELLAIIWSLSKFQNIIWGSQVIIYTDHQALMFLLESRLLHSRLMRWMLFLQDFNIRIEYIKGTENIVSDALSRLPVGMQTTEIQEERTITFGINFLHTSVSKENLKTLANNIRTLVRQDEFFGSKFLECAQGENECFKICDGALFWRKDTSCHNWRLCIPKAVQEELIWLIHKGYGHFGVRKCVKHMARFYFFKNLSRQVLKLIRTCEICQKAKDYCHRKPFPFYPVIPKHLLDLVACDFYGALPTGKGGVQYIFVLIECWAKYVRLYPIKKANTNTVIKCFEDFFQDVGKPSRLLSDNGPQFTSNECKTFLAWNNIKHITISKYNPKSNPSERIMRELGRLFRTYCSEQHSSWANHVKEFQEILNQLPHFSTGLSPLEILNRKFIGEPLLEYFAWPPGPLRNENQIQDKVKTNLIKAGDDRVKCHNQYASVPDYKVGDLVLIKNVSQSSNLKKQTSKFFLKWCGPFTISELPHSKAVYLKDPNSGADKGLYNVDQIRPYVTS